MEIVGQEPGCHRVKNDPYTFKAPWSWSNLILQIKKKIKQREGKWLAEIIKLDKKETCKILCETCLFCEHGCGFVHRVGGIWRSEHSVKNCFCPCTPVHHGDECWIQFGQAWQEVSLFTEVGLDPEIPNDGRKLKSVQWRTS